MNGLKVFLLMGLLTVLLVTIGGAVGGTSGALIFLLISLALNFFSYYFSDKTAISMTRSRPVTEQQAPQFYSIVRELTDKAGLPMPKLYITPSPQPNAFATGRNPEHSAIAVTEGLFKIMKREELAGVLAHELAHIKNRDILIGSLAAAFAGAITMISHVLQWGAIFGGRHSEGMGNAIVALFMAILAPIAAMIIQMTISRSREYQADQTGAEIAGNARGLANALIQLDRTARQIPMQANPASSHLFIVNPLSGGGITRLFSTHPPIAERVERLSKMRF